MMMQQLYTFRVLKTLLLLSSLFCFAPLCAAAEEGNGTIRGMVTTTDDKPAGFVSVALQGTRKAVYTEEDGSFVMHNVPAGTYEMHVSLVGYAPLTQMVTVEHNKTTTLRLRLAISDKQLQEIVVNGRNNKFARKESRQIAKLPIKNLENPQVYTVVSKELIKEQMATDVEETFRNIPGALTIKAGGGSAGIISRGFATFANLRNGMNTGSIGPEDPVNLEQVEAIKGPSATLYGNVKTSYGGLINYVTKKPFDTFKGEVSYTAGSWELNRLTADINAPLNKEKTLLFRITAAGQSENSFQDQGYSKGYTFAPSIRYNVDDRLTVSVSAEMMRTQWRAPSTAWSIGPDVTARSFHDIKLGYDRSLTGNSIYNKNGINSVFVQADYKLSDNWTSQTNYSYSEGYYDYFYYFTYAWLTDSTVARQIAFFTPDRFGDVQFQQNFTGDFKIGPFRNRLVAGLDYSRSYSRLNRSPFNRNYDTVNVLHNISNIDIRQLNEWGAGSTWTATRTIMNIYSVYASDVINFTDNLMVMLSLRLDRFENSGSYNATTGIKTGKYGQTALSPKLGIVYQPIKDKLSLFANYMNGFTNVAPGPQPPEGAIGAFKPQQADQWEGGVKLEILDGRISSTISYYDIHVTNATYADPSNPAFTIQDGTQRSKGFEAEVIASPVAGLNIVAGYGNNENRYIKAAAALQGKLVTWAPRNTANLWISYKLMKGKAKGFGVGAGGNYSGDSWFNSANTFILPGYTLLNASVFYDHPKYTLSIKANNLLDEHYWNTNGTPQKPRNVLAGIAFKF